MHWQTEHNMSIEGSEAEKQHAGWDVPEKVYKGILMFQNDIEDIEKMEVRADDIWVVSWPRSGTTVTQTMTYLIKTEDFEAANTIQLDDRFPFIDIKDDRYPYFRGLKYVEEMQGTRFIKSHLPYSLLPEQLRQGKGKIIYVARNGLDAFISVHRLNKSNNYREGLQPFPDYFQKCMRVDPQTPIVWYGSWWTHVKAAWMNREKSKNMLFLKYEDIVKDKSTVIRKIADHIGKTLSDDMVQKITDHCSIDSMKANKAIDTSMPGLLDIGTIGHSRHVYSKEMLDQMNERTQREFEGTGLTLE